MNFLSFLNKKQGGEAKTDSSRLYWLDYLPTAAFVADLKEGFVRGNERFYELVSGGGDRPVDLRDWCELFDPDDRTKVQESGLEAFIGQTIRCRLAVDRNRWIELEMMRLPDERKEGLISVVLREVSEIIQLEQQAETDRRMLHAILDSSPDLIFVKDAEGHYLMGNRAHLKRLGRSHPREIVGKTVFDFFPPERARQAFEAEKEMIEKGEPVLNLREDDGGVSYLSHKVPFRDADGKVAGFVGISRDVTEMRAVESALQAAKEEAEAGTRAKSEFLANMSHEIRTPMNAVIGMTDLLFETPLTHEQRDFLETIRNSGDALLSIINDILDFSKIESGYLELEQRPVDLRSCIEEALDILSSQASRKGLDLVYLIEPSCPGAVMGDVTRLRQILVNLISNAVKFTSKGEVFVNVSAEPAEGELYRLHFSVKDTGIGIKKEEMARLFRSFSQVDTSTTREYGGTGLGLVISQRLCQVMGGELWCESEPGVGSTFHFTILAEPARGERRVFFRSSQPQLEGKSLLIVDDNPTNRQILLLQAKSWGMVPRMAASGAEALEILESGETFDVAILDWNMPEMDGITLAKKLQENPKTATLPLVMLTSRANLNRAAEEGVRFEAHLTKPVKASHLFDLLVERFSTVSDIEEDGENPAREEGKGLRVLLAEDNAVNQKVALLTLKKLGHDVDVAGNGKEVLEALERSAYDVILMDVQMPEMDGLEATRLVRQLRGSADNPWIIAMTANAMVEDREMCLAAGMNDYLSKPVKIEALQGALANVKKTS